MQISFQVDLTLHFDEVMKVYRLNNMSMASEFRYEVRAEHPRDLSNMARNSGAREDETDNVVIWTFPDGSRAMMRKNRIETLSASEE